MRLTKDSAEQIARHMVKQKDLAISMHQTHALTHCLLDLNADLKSQADPDFPVAGQQELNMIIPSTSVTYIQVRLAFFVFSALALTSSHV